VRIRGLFLLGVMIVISLIYFFFGDFKDSRGAKVKDQPIREGKAVSAEKK
jgi:hypothetical protein